MNEWNMFNTTCLLLYRINIDSWKNLNRLNSLQPFHDPFSIKRQLNSFHILLSIWKLIQNRFRSSSEYNRGKLENAFALTGRDRLEQDWSSFSRSSGRSNMAAIQKSISRQSEHLSCRRTLGCARTNPYNFLVRLKK